MYFLHTIEEDDESEALLQEPEGGSQKKSDETSPHGIRKLRHETDSGSYRVTMAYSEEEPVLLEQCADSNSSTGLAPVEPRNPHDQPNKSPSSSTLGSSSTKKTRSSSVARSPNRGNSTPWSSRRMSLSTQGSSPRRTSSAPSSPSSSAPDEVSRSRPAGRKSGPVKGKSDARKQTTSLKRTGKKAPSTGPRRDSLKRRGRKQPPPEHDDLPAPQWVINLMFDIEEATRHELIVE